MKSSLTVLLIALPSVLSWWGKTTSGQATDMEEFWWESVDILPPDELRHRRETKENIAFFLKKNHTFCYCGKESWINKFQHLDYAITTKCAKQAILNVTEDNDSFKSQLVTLNKRDQCAYDCIFQALHLLSSDGKLNHVATKELFRDKVFVEEGIQDTADIAIDRCLNAGLPSSRYASLRNAKGVNCKPDSFKFILCLLCEMAKECPKNKLRFDEPHCKAMYDKYNIAGKSG